MTEVVTFTPNPAVDMWAEVDRVEPTHKMRTRGVRYDPGGGGVNVARVLHALGDPALAVCLVGGPTASLFRDLAARAGLPVDTIAIAGMTRVSQVVRETTTGLEYRFVPEGPTLSAGECAAGLDALARHRPQWVVASGSLPPGAPDDLYARVAALARANGARVALDTSGAAL
ncbi:PfkB family carbohydrate kinase, partial [Alsobacter sp. SYSU M60028]